MILADAWKRRGAWGLGFFVPFNLYLLPWLPQTPRMTDVLGLGLAIVVAVLVLRRRRMSRQVMARVFVLVCLLLPMLWHGMSLSGASSKLPVMRWLLALPLGLALWKLSAAEATRTPLLKGLACGAMTCALVPVLQVMGFMGETQQLGLAPQDTVDDRFFGFRWRVPGMEQHVNASAVVVGLAVPAALGLIDEKRGHVRWLLLAVAAVLVNSAVTLNRSSVVVTLVVVAAWVLLARPETFSLRKKALLLGVIAAVLVFYGPPGGWERWEEMEQLQAYSGVQVRLTTSLEAAEMAVENPIGTGNTYADDLAWRAGVGATHNALLQLALLGGIPLALWLTMKLLTFSALLLKHTYAERWIAVYLFGIFFFEEYLAVPTLVACSVWLLLMPCRKAKQ